MTLQLQQAWLARIPWWHSPWVGRLEQAFMRFLWQLQPDVETPVLLAAALLTRQLAQGAVYLDLSQLQDIDYLGLEGESPAGLVWSVLAECSPQVLLRSPLIGVHEGAEPLVLDLSRQRLYLRRYWRCQQVLDQVLPERLEACETALPAVIAQQLASLFPEEVSGVDWQKVACVLALRSRFSIITGGPGTGKTTTLTKLLAVLIGLHQQQIQSTDNLRILLAAPTGKAAARVSESIAAAVARLPLSPDVLAQMPKQAFTLHRLLGVQAHGGYRHDARRPLLADIVIVDEASMIDLEMMAALLTALSPTTRLILLGDKDQLASVEAGAVLGELCAGADLQAYAASTRAWIERYTGYVLPAAANAHPNLCHQQTVMLKLSHRFGQDSGIGQLAAAVNAGQVQQARQILADPRYDDLHAQVPDLALLPIERLRHWVQANHGHDQTGQPAPGQGYGYFRAVIAQRPRQRDPARIDQWAQQVLRAFDRFRVLGALRQGQWGVEGLNRMIEQWLVGGYPDQSWYVGRPVMVTRNDYALGLMNGDIGITLKDQQDRLRVVFWDEHGKIRWISPLRLAAVETAYAMTVHKSQGSEFDHVALILPETLNPVLSRELIYTGITRAKTRFTLLETAAGIFETAIQRHCRGRFG